MNQPKTYAPGSAKLRSNCQWWELSYSFKAEAMIEFIQRHTNSKGFVNLKINERKETGKYGETHSVLLDPWEPKATQQQAAQGFAQARQAVDNAGGDEPVPF